MSTRTCFPKTPVGVEGVEFTFATAGRIVFGPGSLGQLAPWIAENGRRALIVTGNAVQRTQPVFDQTESAGVAIDSLRVTSEPTVDFVREGAERARRSGCQVVIGFGGGSAMDAAKAIAILATNPGDPLEYLEVIGRGRALPKPGLPVAAIPTTAGTGAEVTRNAVLASPAERVKVSLRSAHILPRLALVDPLLTHSMPPDVTAASGLDALTQLIEAFTTHRSNPVSDGHCREGLRRVAACILSAYRTGDAVSREGMALASLLSGLGLANSGLGAVHGFAGPIGGRFSAPHGAVCASLLPHAMAVNLRAMEERLPGCEALQRYREIAVMLTGRDGARAMDGIEWISETCEELKIPRLRSYAAGVETFPDLIEAAEGSSSMQGNPIRLERGEMQEILTLAL